MVCVTVPVVYFVVPCYCEEDMLPVSAPVFLKKLESLISAGKADEKSKVVFVDDGSSDNTWSIIKKLSADNARIEGVRLAHNAGEDNAQRAGMFCALERADCIVSMDCDLQDDIDAVDEMLDKLSAGADIILGIRSTRDEDPLKERFFSASYYLVMKLLRTGLIKNQANCRLLSIAAVREVLKHEEASYLPALVSSLPLKKKIVYYKRKAREKGTTKYNFIKKLTLALDSIVLHAKGVRMLLLGASAASFCVAAVFLALLLKTAALAALWCVLAVIFCLAGAAAAGVCIAYKQVYARVCSRNKTGFEIAETTF